MTLPSTCAPSLIRRSEARNSPSIRPKTCAGPLQSILPTMDMSEPMQEAVPAVGSDLVKPWSCGCTVPRMTFAATFLSFSVTPFFMLSNMSHVLISLARSVKRLRLSYCDQAWADAALFPSRGRTFRLARYLRGALRKPSFNALQIGVNRWGWGRGWFLHVFFLRIFGGDARQCLRWILNPPRRSFKLRVLVDRQRFVKNITPRPDHRSAASLGRHGWCP